MKVLHILNQLNHSGAEVMLQIAFEKFKRRGIESHILSTGDQLGDYAAVLQQAGYSIHHIPFRKCPRFFFDIRKLINSEKFTVVHIHTERAFIWYALVARAIGIRTVVRTFHNVFLFSSYLRWKRKLQRKASARVLRTVHTAVGNSVLAVEKERFNNDCILIRNWFDVERFKPPSEEERADSRQIYDLEPDDFVIVTIGGCSPVKNHLELFSALKKANNALDRKRIICLHVGTGPMLGEEQLFVRHHGIEKYCKFIGTLNDVRPCLYAADAFVMTSRYEGLPIAAIEAIGTGLPTILYDVYGLRDLLQDDKGGILIEPKEGCLVDALLMMSRSSETRKIHAQEDRKQILDRYSLEDSVNKLIQLYTPGNRGEEKPELNCNL